MKSPSVTLAKIYKMPVGEIAALDADQLYALQQEASVYLEEVKRLKSWLDGAIVLKFEQQAKTLRQQQGKDTGTVRLEDAGITVIADLPKRVVWDQNKLLAAVKLLQSQGKNPAEYVDVTYKVAESKYKAWPSDIQSMFMGARTLQTGKPSFRLEKQDGAS